MKRPEILFDAPTRVEPERPLPLFLFIKDADRYPVVLEDVSIHLHYENGMRRIGRFPYGGLRIDTPIWWDSFNIHPEFSGQAIMHCSIRLRLGKKHVIVYMDNYRGSGKTPLSVNVSSSKLPTGEGWYHGDIHCHTYYTSDQVEFGAPLEAMAFAGYCMGMDWMAATDHSYDLDDRENDYRAEDPLHTKWRMMKNESQTLTDSLRSFTVIPGEEVTCRTHEGRNCHLLALNADAFIKGSGDSGERGLSSTTERTVGEAVAECLEWGGLACAAHPLEHIPLLERLFLGRGSWTLPDMETPGLSALQIHNGIRDRGFTLGMRTWIQLLLQGRRISAFGGNDAHGDLNYRRGVSLPFLSLYESRKRAFGGVRTLVYAPSQSAADITEALRAGRAQVTEGPFIDLTVAAGDRVAHPGGTVSPGRFTVRAVLKSSPEFGLVKTARILAGRKGAHEEQVLAALDVFPRTDYQYLYEGACDLGDLLYIRAECETVKGKLCFTNPVWVGRE
ncbi:MAG: CehA/McbA family metallohydrolase [Candidatus Latescibacter sp.]|nr:CehA/McbA family metallohydrolase [Candidatus Latescibacter sp.]